MNRSTLTPTLVTLLLATSCATTPEPAPEKELPKDAAQIPTEDLAKLVAKPLPTSPVRTRHCPPWSR